MHRHLVYMEVHITRAATHKLEQAHSNINIMCLWFSTQPGLFSWGASLSELSRGWMETPCHSWRISAHCISIMYFFYLREKFSPPAQRWCFLVLKSGTRDKWRGSFLWNKVLIWMKECMQMCVCVCLCTLVCVCVFKWEEWTEMNSWCIWVRAIIKQCELSGLNTHRDPQQKSEYKIQS